MSNDVNRFDMAAGFLNFIWVMPIVVPIVSFLVWQHIGWATLAALLVIFVQTVVVQGTIILNLALFYFVFSPTSICVYWCQNDTLFTKNKSRFFKLLKYLEYPSEYSSSVISVKKEWPYFETAKKAYLGFFAFRCKGPKIGTRLTIQCLSSWAFCF